MGTVGIVILTETKRVQHTKYWVEKETKSITWAQRNSEMESETISSKEQS